MQHVECMVRQKLVAACHPSGKRKVKRWTDDQPFQAQQANAEPLRVRSRRSMSQGGVQPSVYAFELFGRH